MSPFSNGMNMQKDVRAKHILHLIRELLTLAYDLIHISPNDLSKFPSAALSSVNDATTSPLLPLADRKFILHYLVESE